MDGLITDANALVQQGVRERGWFDVATLREPYRLEGKKTMGYELFEQFGGALPDVVVYPTNGFLILRAVRESQGTAIAVTDEETREAWGEFSARTGVFAAPEGAATYAALKRLVAQDWVGKGETVVLFNTGSGTKYLEAWFRDGA